MYNYFDVIVLLLMHMTDIFACTTLPPISFAFPPSLVIENILTYIVLSSWRLKIVILKSELTFYFAIFSYSQVGSTFCLYSMHNRVPYSTLIILSITLEYATSCLWYILHSYFNSYSLYFRRFSLGYKLCRLHLPVLWSDRLQIASC